MITPVNHAGTQGTRWDAVSGSMHAPLFQRKSRAELLWEEALWYQGSLTRAPHLTLEDAGRLTGSTLE
jgi:hypothetical protein